MQYVNLLTKVGTTEYGVLYGAILDIEVQRLYKIIILRIFISYINSTNIKGIKNYDSL